MGRPPAPADCGGAVAGCGLRCAEAHGGSMGGAVRDVLTGCLPMARVPVPVGAGVQPGPRLPAVRAVFLPAGAGGSPLLPPVRADVRAVPVLLRHHLALRAPDPAPPGRVCPLVRADALPGAGRAVDRAVRRDFVCAGSAAGAVSYGQLGLDGRDPPALPVHPQAGGHAGQRVLPLPHPGKRRQPAENFLQPNRWPALERDGAVRPVLLRYAALLLCGRIPRRPGDSAGRPAEGAAPPGLPSDPACGGGAPGDADPGQCQPGEQPVDAGGAAVGGGRLVFVRPDRPPRPACAPDPLRSPVPPVRGVLFHRLRPGCPVAVPLWVGGGGECGPGPRGGNLPVQKRQLCLRPLLQQDGSGRVPGHGGIRQLPQRVSGRGAVRAVPVRV